MLALQCSAGAHQATRDTPCVPAQVEEPPDTRPPLSRRALAGRGGRSYRPSAGADRPRILPRHLSVRNAALLGDGDSSGGDDEEGGAASGWPDSSPSPERLRPQPQRGSPARGAQAAPAPAEPVTYGLSLSEVDEWLVSSGGDDDSSSSGAGGRPRPGRSIAWRAPAPPTHAVTSSAGRSPRVGPGGGACQVVPPSRCAPRRSVSSRPCARRTVLPHVFMRIVPGVADCQHFTKAALHIAEASSANVAGLCTYFAASERSTRAWWEIWEHEECPRCTRWDADVGWHEHDALNKRFGAFVDGAELFDARAFGVARPEAAAMDAQQRLLLEAAHEALAGSAPRDLTGLPLCHSLGMQEPMVSAASCATGTV